jgi:hypothetical protein
MRREYAAGPETGEGMWPSRCFEMPASMMLLSKHREAPMAVKSHSHEGSMASRVSWSVGRTRCMVPRSTAHHDVRQVRQLCQALRPVARAEPRGAMRSVKAWLMDSGFDRGGGRASELSHERLVAVGTVEGRRV